MKKLITIAILTLGAALNFAARASTISGPVEDLTGSTNTVNVVLMLKQPVTNGGVFIYTSQKQFTATNGYLGPITNVQPGNYNVQIGPRNDLLQMTVPADTNTYTLQALINGGITWPYSTSPSFLLLSGGTMTGNLTAPAFIGDGSGITNLNPLNLSSAVTIAKGGTGNTTLIADRTSFGGNQAIGSDTASIPSVANFASLTGDFIGQRAYSAYQEVRWTGSGWTGQREFVDAISCYSTNANHRFWVSNSVDNCVELRNFDLAHFSAMRWLDAGGSEKGAIGFGNTGASLYPNINYLEDFGAGQGFYFASAGNGLCCGMEKTTGDFVVLAAGTTPSTEAANVKARLTKSGTMTLAGKITSYNGITPSSATQGIPIIVFDNSQTGSTAQFNNVTLFTVGGSDGTFQINTTAQSASVGTAGTLTVTWNYTDQLGNARTYAGCGAVTLGAVGAPTNGVIFIRAKASTTIGITTSISGGGGGSTYNFDCDCLQLR
ncbi:MAG TPA: hypothetical protein VFC07_00875 [Verrucomicrobiae bacterium]|nr:hypothetical protein [Verrucomicrobiae bacterium]